MGISHPFPAQATLLFGTQNAAFSTLGFSLMALVDILFGDFGSIADAKNAGTNLTVIIFFYSFVGIMSLTGAGKGCENPNFKGSYLGQFHSFRLIFGRVSISRNGLERERFSLERAPAEHPR